MDDIFKNIPASAQEYIKLVIKKMRYRKKVRADVQAELITHFEDALSDCKTQEEKENVAQELITNFGNAKMLGKLARRAKKRCRPLWAKMIIRSLQALGIIILYLGICIAYMTIGSPNVSVNYVEELNDYVRDGRNESLNCRELLEEAGELVVVVPDWLDARWVGWPNDFNDADIVKAQKWMAENEPAYEKMREALEKPYYWNVYDVNKSNFMMGGCFEAPMKRMKKYRQLVQALGWQIKYLIYKNDVPEAIDEVIRLCGFGKRMRGNGLLVEQLVGISVEAMGLYGISDMLDRAEISAEQLGKLQMFLQAEMDKPVIDMRAEKFFFYDLVQRTFTDDGNGGGRPLKTGAGFAGKNTREVILNILTYNLPDRREVVGHIDELYDTFQQSFGNPDFRNIDAKIADMVDGQPFLLGLLTPSIGKIAELSWRLRTQENGIVALLAILRYEKQVGEYPESLDELVVKGFLEKMPFDAFRNGPMSYRKTEGEFTLYSFGLDFDDDGGDAGIDNRGKPASLWKAVDGDVVFWPVER